MTCDHSVNNLGAAIDSSDHVPYGRQVEGAGRGAHYELPEKWLGNGSNGSTDGGQGGNGSIGATCLRIMIRDPVAASLGLEIDDFDLPPFSQQGGLGRVHQLFGAELPKVIEELNRELVA